jgi:hypothetical protein
VAREYLPAWKEQDAFAIGVLIGLILGLLASLPARLAGPEIAPVAAKEG